MYVVSWYSYKGGVGRSMSLVNVAIELAQNGQRVLMVDFDLEAPGIETFNLPKPRDKTPGIVEYVCRFIESRKSPDVAEYIYESAGVGDNGGGVWIMPAGIQDESYGKRLNGIDWQRLYAEQDGFLMFEDLKAQWKELDVDYVFIDSRTGHTDVGNICTRQLPDAVCVLFFPNEQNLLGLQRVVANIRDDQKRKDIALHFVTSNVPELDDEDQILENRFRRFRELLGYKRLAATIHHYNSLALLNQVIFTSARPKSRLAAEYRFLCQLIRQYNPEDREGALKFLRTLSGPTKGRGEDFSVTTVDDRLAQIAVAHASDGEVLFHVANVRRRQGRHEQALSLIDDAISNEFANAEVLLARAELQMLLGPGLEARSDLETVLSRDDVSYFELSRTIRWLWQVSPASLEQLPECRAFAAMDVDGKLGITSNLLRDDASLRIAKAILQSFLEVHECNAHQRAKALNVLTLCLIGLGEFSAAIKVTDQRSTDGEFIENLFNCAMAKWGKTQELDADLLERVVVLGKDKPPQKVDANFRQCLALAYWGIGAHDDSRTQISQARQICMIRGGNEFSAWRYRVVSTDDFLADLDELESMVDGSGVQPSFLTQQGTIEA